MNKLEKIEDLEKGKLYFIKQAFNDSANEDTRKFVGLYSLIKQKTKLKTSKHSVTETCLS